MKIILATGGSGGHVIPALYVADQLRDMGHAVMLAGELERQRSLWESRGYAGRHFDVKGMTGNSLSHLMDFGYCMVKSTFAACGFLRREQAAGVLGFGGYGAVPVVMGAVLLRIPVMLHEQNVIPGRANRMISKFADRVAVSFEAGRSYFRPELSVLTGCPCRPLLGQRHDASHRVMLREKFGLERDRITVLVMGGSQGSATLNQIVPAALITLLKKLSLQVIHIAGPGREEQVQAVYRDLNIPHVVFGFFNRIEEAYAVTDLVVSRAGAVTIHELDAYQFPAVIIPYPHAGGHQQANAEALLPTGRVKILQESGLAAESVAAGIADCAEQVMVKRQEDAKAASDRSFHPESLKEQQYRVFRADAAQRIADEMTRLVESRRDSRRGQARDP